MKYVIATTVGVVGLGALLLATEKEQIATAASAVSSSEETVWITDYKKAQQQAKSTHKFLLLQFTGSDWCPPCRLMQKEILSTREFQDYASKNFVLMEVDFPRARVQAPEVAEQNQMLAHQFGIEAFPTIIILNTEGKKVGELVGFDPRAGLQNYLASLEKIRKG